MKIIPRDARILSISHCDLDGSVCQIILGQVYKNIKYIYTSFYRIDEILVSLDYDNYDYVFLTDISPDKPENLELSNKIVLIDHHGTTDVLNDPSKMRFVISDSVCASVLTKRFIEHMYGIKLSHLDKIVELTNDYDMWHLKYPKSKFLNDVMFYLYRPAKFISKFFDGRTRFTNEEITWLKKRREIFKDIYSKLEVFEFTKINGCIVQAEEFINEIADKLMNEEGYEIVVVRNTRNGRVSVRHRIEGIDVGAILKEKGWGGGHSLSAGFFSTNMDDFKNKVEELETIIESRISAHV